MSHSEKPGHQELEEDDWTGWENPQPSSSSKSVEEDGWDDWSIKKPSTSKAMDAQETKVSDSRDSDENSEDDPTSFNYREIDDSDDDNVTHPIPCIRIDDGPKYWFPDHGTFKVPDVDWKLEKDKNLAAFKLSGQKRPQYEHVGVWKRTIAVNLKTVNYTEHPRKSHIESQTPVAALFKAPDTADTVMREELKYELVDTKEALVSLAQKLENLEEIAVDMEFVDSDSRQGYISLIQIHTIEHGCFLVDAIILHRYITEYLKPIFEAESPIKILHGCSNDVLFSQRDFDIFFSSIMDTQTLFKTVNAGEDIKYEHMVYAFFPKLKDDLQKVQTHSDWSVRPLQPDQKHYAASDAYYLLMVYKKMKMICLEHGQDGLRMLRKCFENSKKKSLQLFVNKEKSLDDVNFERDSEVRLKKLIRYAPRWKNHRCWTDKQKLGFRHLIEWRYRLSLVLDKFPELVLTDVELFKICNVCPSTPQQLKDCLTFNSIMVEEEEKVIKVIIRILADGEQYIQRMRTLECFNCFGRFHGPAKFCPYFTIPGNYKQWHNRPENLHIKQRQGRTRWENWERNKARQRAERQENHGRYNRSDHRSSHDDNRRHNSLSYERQRERGTYTSSNRGSSAWSSNNRSTDHRDRQGDYRPRTAGSYHRNRYEGSRESDSGYRRSRDEEMEQYYAEYEAHMERREYL